MFALLIVAVELVVMTAVTGALLYIFTSELYSSWSGAPFLPIPSSAVDELLRFARITPFDTVTDLGCGDGRILDAALQRGAVGAVGYEVSWLPMLLARRRLRPWGTKAVLIRQDARTADVSAATLVYLYLFPRIVDELASKLSRELGPGARVISMAFPIDVTKHGGLRLLETKKIGKIDAYLYERVLRRTVSS